MKNTGGWAKILKNGEIIRGSDEDVDSLTVSWRNSSQDIYSVQTWQTGGSKELRVELSGAKKYWQSDMYLAPFTGPVVKGIRIKRRIMFKIEDFHLFLNVHIHNTDNYFGMKISAVSQIQDLTPESIPLKIQNVGKWLIAEIDIEKEEINLFISDKM